MEKYRGLTTEEVKIRINKKLVNYDTTTPSKSIKQIILENTCTLFNFINIVLATLIIMVGSYKNLLFLGVVICNTLISTIQEIRAKKVVDKLSVISSSKVKVIRDNKKVEISVNDIVLDDLAIYNLGNQIVTDSTIISGTCEVNESFITGEAKTVYKKEGDTLLSGSFIVSGSVEAKVIHIGLDNYTSIISHDAKEMKKEINSQIMRSLNKIVKYVSIALIPIGILLLLKQFSIPTNTTRDAIVSVVAAIVGMIPEGLILLVSTVLAISTLKLSKYNVLVQDLYAIETLARVDTLCLDKTGTLTQGKMEIADVISLDKYKINEIDEALEIISTNLDDNNPTFLALNNKYGNNSKIKAVSKIPFSSDRKYSGVILKDKSYIMGAPEFVLEEKYDKYKKKIETYSEENRVLVLVKATPSLENKEAMALILIHDKIRKESISTLNYFMENDCDIKIISGDSPSTIKSVAKSVGLDIKGVFDARCINEDTNLNLIVEENNIFARVKPEQKRMLIRALKNNGHVVAMTGDGVNDVLALKESDCGVAMNDGTDAARNVSELVLLDSNFDSMKEVVKEGRRTINNVERSASLFLSKTIYASVLAVLFLFINYKYPFEPIQMSLISSLTIGMPAFILALEPNLDRVNGKFLINVIKKSIPSGITTVINIILIMLLSCFVSISKSEVSTIAVILTSYTAVLLIYKISKPLNLLRKSLLITIITLFLIAFIIPQGRDLYSLTILKPNAILILIFLIYASTKIFKLFDKLIEKLIKEKPWWFS